MAMRIIATLTLLALPAAVAAADLVVLDNGDSLTGRVVTMVEGVLQLDTDYAGVLPIAWGRVAHLQLDQPLPVALADGTELEADLLPRPGVELADVAAIAPPPPPPRPPVRWRGRADLGYGVTGGNRRSELGTLTILAERRHPARHRLSLLLDAARGSSEGERTADRARAQAKLDRRLGGADYRYLLAGAGHDKIREFDLRVELGAGLGRTLLDTDAHQLGVELGASWVRDAFADGATRSDGKVRIGQIWQCALTGRTGLGQTLAFLSALDEFSHFSLEFVLALSHAVSDRLTLVTKLVDSYESRPAPGTKRNDFTLTTQLGVVFGG